MKVVARETLVFDTEENSLTESANKRNGENMEMATFWSTELYIILDI